MAAVARLMQQKSPNLIRANATFAKIQLTKLRSVRESSHYQKRGLNAFKGFLFKAEVLCVLATSIVDCANNSPNGSTAGGIVIAKCRIKIYLLYL